LKLQIIYRLENIENSKNTQISHLMKLEIIENIQDIIENIENSKNTQISHLMKNPSS